MLINNSESIQKMSQGDKTKIVVNNPQSNIKNNKNINHNNNNSKNKIIGISANINQNLFVNNKLQNADVRTFLASNTNSQSKLTTNMNNNINNGLNTFIPYKRLASNNTKNTKTNLNNSKTKKNLYITTDPLKKMINPYHLTTKNSPAKRNNSITSGHTSGLNSGKASCYMLHSNTQNNSEKISIINSPKSKNNTLLDNFLEEIERYNKEVSQNNFVNLKSFNKGVGIISPSDSSVFNFNKIFDIFDKNNTPGYEKLSNIWKNFLLSLDKTASMLPGKNNFINNINLSTQNVINNNNSNLSINNENNGNSLLFEQLKNDYNNLKIQMREELNIINNKLKEKDREIKELNSLLERKDKYIKDLEIMLNDINKKFDQDRSATLKSPQANGEADEYLYYSHKQLMRDFKMLSQENKNLRDSNNQLETELNQRKEKEIKIMQLLFYLNRKGIPIEEIIENESFADVLGSNPHDDNSSIYNKNLSPSHSIAEIGKILNKSAESTLFTPITIDPPISKTLIKKPEKIPALNLDNINSKFNSEYVSPVNKTDNLNNKNQKYKYNKKLGLKHSIDEKDEKDEKEEFGECEEEAENHEELLNEDYCYIENDEREKRHETEMAKSNKKLVQNNVITSSSNNHINPLKQLNLNFNKTEDVIFKTYKNINKTAQSMDIIEMDVTNVLLSF